MVLVWAVMAVGGWSVRQTIDLDAGWQFARLAKTPTAWEGPDAVPTTDWKVLSVSSQETAAENGKATNAFDNNPNTFWHTEWSQHQPNYPHELEIDLGSRVSAKGVRILPRQTSPQHGRPHHFDLYLSNDRQHWGTPVFRGDAPNSSDLYLGTFPNTTGRFMRLVFKDGYRPEPFLALSEIGLIRELDLKDQKSWASQYNIAKVQIGDQRFDLKGSLLENVKSQELATLKKGDWQTATLPHSAWIRPMGTSAIWQGVTYYHKTLLRPKGTSDKDVVLTIEAAMQSSDIWLNGVHVGGRRGGYLPIVVDLSKLLREKNDLLVRVDNSDNPLFPPGKAQQDLDFVYGSGLYRNAFLTVTDPVHITDPILENIPRSGGVYVTFPEVTPEHATVRVRTHLRNRRSKAGSFVIRQVLRDENLAPIGIASQEVFLPANSARQFTQDISVANPRLWSPETPSLYKVDSVIIEKNDVLDDLTTTVGIRKVEVSRDKGFVLNGKPIRLDGTNRHQDYPWVGPALSDQANARDALLIRKAGHNIVRLSHYPQSTFFLNACDHFGLMCIPCTAGWQFLNSDPRFGERVRQDIRELIRLDRNHPSAVFWEPSLNETYPPLATAQDWYQTAKSESLDGRIICASDGVQGGSWDIVYNQWKDEDGSRPQSMVPNKPGYVREYGDYEFGGPYSTTRVRIGAGMDKLLQEVWNQSWSLNRLRPQYPWTMGVGTWAMFDCNGPWQFQISAWGLADIFRREKPSFWFYQSQSDDKPIVKIAATWQPGKDRRHIIVFTNCDSADLQVNGKTIARAQPMRGLPTSYDKAKPFDGTNTDHLVHPAIVFEDVPFSPGTLKVIGIVHGHPVTSDTLRTAYSPKCLKLWIDDLGIAPKTNDLLFIRAAIVDSAGTVCPGEVRKIKFRVSGEGVRVGDEWVGSELGIASNLVRTAKRGGKIVVEASTEDGLSGSTTIEIP